MSINPGSLRTLELVYNIPALVVGTHDGIQGVVDDLNQQASGITLFSSLSSLAGTALTFSPVGSLAANTVTLSIQLNKALNEGVTVGDVLSIAGSATALIGAALVIGSPLTPIAVAFTGVGLALTLTQAIFNDAERKTIATATNTSFQSARAVVLQRDPLVLDLDGDGLELSAASGNVLFDHNADGIKTGTGWARPDDGFLVRDLNGNGSIDSGRELFGVDTLKSNGQLATQGFDALADLDSNGDGQITALDAAWAQLQVWRDTNQDGISQSGELSGLDALGITRIGLNGSSSGPQAGQTINNNRVALSTTFTRNGATRTVGAIDLQANGFFSEIPPEVVDEEGNPVVISEGAQALPQMNGSGMVRSLRGEIDAALT